MDNEALSQFKNSDDFLKQECPKIVRERESIGLEGLVGGLDSVIINTETENLIPTVEDFLRWTNLKFIMAFEDSDFITVILKNDEFENYLIRSRKRGTNPFSKFNGIGKTNQLPNTRLETFVFLSDDIYEYVKIQKSRGVKFLTDDVIQEYNYYFIQTEPSIYTGNSVGIIQWHGMMGNYFPPDAKMLKMDFNKPEKPYLSNIKKLDHAATRVKSQDRDEAIIEFMRLTNYHFDFAIYVESLNSITNVSRLSSQDFALVFTSGIKPYTNDEESGPTEMFIKNYGQRVHHLAFETENIEETFEQLKADGMEFLIELVGSREEGLKQTFTIPSPHTFLVTEYIQRYDGFDGFFTKSNVTALTASTAKQ